jgi:hypothetical protein
VDILLDVSVRLPVAPVLLSANAVDAERCPVVVVPSEKPRPIL